MLDMWQRTAVMGAEMPVVEGRRRSRLASGWPSIEGRVCVGEGTFADPGLEHGPEMTVKVSRRHLSEFGDTVQELHAVLVVRYGCFRVGVLLDDHEDGRVFRDVPVVAESSGFIGGYLLGYVFVTTILPMVW